MAVNRRVVGAAALLAVALAVTATLAVPALAAEQSATNETDGLTLESLQSGGTQLSGAPPSVRMASDTESFSIRHDPGQPFASSDWYYLGQQQTVQVDDLRLRSVRLGDVEEKEYEVRIAYWNPDTRTVSTGDDTVTERFANVSHVETEQITLSRNYDGADLTLKPSYESGQQVTLCVREPGEPDCLERGTGPRWGPFTHQSVPTSQQVPIDDRGDLLGWLATNFLLIAVPGTFGAAYTAKRWLRRTGCGPNLGTFAWLMLVGLAGGGLAMFAWTQTATVMANAPQILALLLVGVTFVVFLEAFDGKVSKVLFERDELTAAKSPQGDDVHDTLYQDQVSKRIVRMDNGRFQIVRRGIRPFLARLWADGAKLDLEELRTQIEVNHGPWDKKFIAHPDSDEVLVHERAKLAWSPTLIHPAGEDADGGLSGLVERINWKLIVTAIGGPLIGGALASQLVGISAVGWLVGLLPAIVMSIEARDGHAEFRPAPRHLSPAKAQLAYERTMLADGETIEDLESEVAEEQTKTAQDARRVQENLDTTVTEEMNKRALGLNEDEGGPSTNGHKEPEEVESDD